MPARRSRPVAPADLPAPLRHIISAAHVECPPGHAEALAALIGFASHKVPGRGILDPGVRDEPEFFLAIETIAKAHLELSEARAAWRQALKAANLGIEVRDDIEATALQVQGVSDTAYFYTGLAFGLTFAALWRMSS